MNTKLLSVDTVVISKYKQVHSADMCLVQLIGANYSLVQPRTPYCSLFKMNPVPYSLVLPPNYPHSISYSPTGVDLVVLGCAELLGSGDLFWGLVGRAGLC